MRHATAVAFPFILLLIFCPSRTAYAADSGDTLYKARCAQCHGNNGQGRPRRKAPSLVSAEIKKMSDDELKSLIQQRTNGEMEHKSSHTKLKKRLTAGQVAEHIGHIRKMQAQ